MKIKIRTAHGFYFTHVGRYHVKFETLAQAFNYVCSTLKEEARRYYKP